jgi:hypothetical protein
LFDGVGLSLSKADACADTTKKAAVRYGDAETPAFYLR